MSEHTTPADRLAGEMNRLFGGSGEAGMTRAFRLRVLRQSDWSVLSGLLAGLEADLDLPLPAVSVEAEGGFQVWFSVAEPVAVNEAAALLEGICRRYMSSLPAGRVSMITGFSGESRPEMPFCHPDTGRWSAFIDPGMGALFADEPGLDLSPGRDRQADLLAGVRSMTRRDVARVLAELQPAPSLIPQTGGSAVPDRIVCGWQNVGSSYTDPRDFLRAVMNDPTALPAERLRAAEVLLRDGGNSSCGRPGADPETKE